MFSGWSGLVRVIPAPYPNSNHLSHQEEPRAGMKLGERCNKLKVVINDSDSKNIMQMKHVCYASVA